MWEIMYLKEKKALCVTMCAEQSRGGDRGRANVHDGGGSQIEKFEDFRPGTWLVLIDRDVAQ